MLKWFAGLTVSFVGAALLRGNAALWLTAVGLILLLAIWLADRAVFIRIPEMEVGVIFNKRKQAFARFLPTGRHALNPFTERWSHNISTSSGSASGRCLGAQTSGGIALDIEWAVNFDIDPFQIGVMARPKLARKLPQKAKAIVTKHLNNCLRHVIGELTIDALCQPGAVKRLERACRQRLAARLSEAGFSFPRVMLGTIEMPAHVKAALEAAQQQAVQTENEARSLARLQEVVSQFSEADMQRLIELERIHTLGQNGVTLLYPTAVGEVLPAERPSYAKIRKSRRAAPASVPKI